VRIDARALSSTPQHGETGPQPPQATEKDRLAGVYGSAAAVVFGYIEARAQGQDSSADAVSLVEQLLRRVKELDTKVKELEANLAELAEADQRASELRRSVDALKAHNEFLQETIRTLEIGFRRHVSERISSDQLQLAMTADPGVSLSQPALVPPEADVGEASPPSDAAEAGDASPTRSGSEQEAGEAAPPSGSGPGGQKQRNRNNHGRRRVGIIPKVIIETLPPDVLLKGIERFERVGAEESSVIGHRRGGLIDVVFRRPKYVLRTESSAAVGMIQETSAPSPSTAPASTSEPDDAVVVRCR